MARNESYGGSIDLISGLRPKNNGSFPLIDAHDVQVEEDGTRLDEVLQNTIKALGLSIVDGKICQTYYPFGNKNDIYKSMSKIADIVRNNSVEQNTKIFPIGDQIIMPWKDMDDPEHNTDETAYQVEWDIVHHGMVTLQDGREVPGMYLQMHRCSAYGVQFSHRQAFMNCPEGLAAGTYYVAFDSGNSSTPNPTEQFTLTQNVPAGGRLSGFELIPNVGNFSFSVESWASPTDDNPIETVTVTSGNSGIFLGTILRDSIGEDGLNSRKACGSGHNRWSTSALRQYLNAFGTNWFSSKEDFDIRPDQYNKRGFMTGFDDEFLNAIKPVKITTALNTVGGFADATEDTFDTFFLPSLEQFNATPEFSGVEGDYFEYWRNKLGLTDFAMKGSGNNYDAYKIPAINVNSAQDVRLRSAQLDYAEDTWIIDSLGSVNISNADSALRFSAVCVVC